MLIPNDILHDFSTGFKAKIISATENPNTVMYQALHTDYSAKWIGNKVQLPDERECGRICVKRLLHSKVYHCGVFEHPQLVITFGYLNTATVNQLRTHRHMSFDVQSMRYTSEQFIEAASSDDPKAIEEVYYVRPVGTYSDRFGQNVHFSNDMREECLERARETIREYADKILCGYPAEMARNGLFSDYRQHCVVSGNLRSWLHVLDLRLKPDAQLEIVSACELVWLFIQDWVPEIAEHYQKHNYKKASIGY